MAGFIIHVWLAGGFADAIRLLAHGGRAMPLPEVIAYALAVLFGIRFVIVKAWYAARNLRPDMNLLMTVAIAGAIVIGEWFEAAAFLFALSLALESWSVARARRAIATLLDLAPPIVRLLRADGSEANVPVAEVSPGDRRSFCYGLASGFSRKSDDDSERLGQQQPADPSRIESVNHGVPALL